MLDLEAEFEAQAKGVTHVDFVRFELHPIVPESGLYLQAFGHGDDARFAAQFAKVWNAIPIEAQQRMGEYWNTSNSLDRVMTMFVKRGEQGDPPSLISPRIQLLHGWDKPTSGLILTEHQPDRWGHEPPKVRPDVGVSYASGFLLRFWAPAFLKMSEHLAAYVIAHELAHVYQDALGVTGSNEELERDADETVAEWGFDHSDELDRWAVEQGWAKALGFLSVEAMNAYIAKHGTRHTAPAKKKAKRKKGKKS